MLTILLHSAALMGRDPLDTLDESSRCSSGVVWGRRLCGGVRA